jgi:hypothetical protein
VKEATDEEADSLSTPCSLCHMSLDIYQGPARRANTSLKLPVLHLPQLRGLAMGIRAMDLMFSRHLGRWIRPSRSSRYAGLHRSQPMRPAFFQARTRAKRPCTRRPGLDLPGTGKVKCTFQVWPEKQVLDPWEAMSLTAEEYGVKKHTAQRLKVFLFVIPNPA